MESSQLRGVLRLSHLSFKHIEHCAFARGARAPCTPPWIRHLLYNYSIGSLFTGVGGCSVPPGWMDPWSIHPRMFGPGGPFTLG